MKLPGGARAIVPEEKVRDYLLSTSHPVGRFKAAFFAAVGYADENWGSLRDALLEIARDGDASPGKPTPHGVKYEVHATLDGPSGRSASIATVWIVLTGEDLPRFVTAFPD